MDIEHRQAEHIDYFVKQASIQKGVSVANVVVEATSHPSLFAFSEILSVPNVLEGKCLTGCNLGIVNGTHLIQWRRGVDSSAVMFVVNYLKIAINVPMRDWKCLLWNKLQGTEHSVYLDLLRLFAHGTWSDYKSNASHLLQLVPDQILKLKQLTVLTLAETDKELDITNVRELEDFLINECMYVGIVRGKLDQLRRCFEVQFAAGRDLRPGQLGSMIQTLSNWLTTSDNLLITIQEKIKWADTMSELDKKHRKEVEERVDEIKTSLSLKVREVTHCKQADIDFRGHEEIFSEPGGVMDYEEERSRPKRRRHPLA
ncbi:unnamed protein product [Camellia sinensis]